MAQQPAAGNYDHLTYKNGKPYQGSKKNFKGLASYKAGRLHGLQEKYSDAGITQERRYYTEGRPDSVIYFNYSIKDNLLLAGVYQNGRSYNGYFLKEESIPDGLYQMEVYKDGQIEKEYSQSIVSQMVTAYQTGTDIRDDYGLPHDLPYQTTYRNGRPFNGRAYHTGPDRRSIWEQLLLNGRTTKINIGIFAVHAAALLTIEPLTNGYRISQYEMGESNGKIKADTQALAVTYTDSSRLRGRAAYLYNHRLLMRHDWAFYPVDAGEQATGSNSAKRYLLTGNSLTVLTITNRSIDTVRSEEIHFNLNDHFIFFKPDFEQIKRLMPLLDKKNRWLAGLDYDEDGKRWGTDIRKDKNGTYSYRTYGEGKITGQATGLSLDGLRKKFSADK